MAAHGRAGGVRHIPDRGFVVPRLTDAEGALRQAMLKIGITTNIFRGHSIGFFLGALDLSSVEALSTGLPRRKRPRLSWDLAVQQFRCDFGEAERPTKMPGLNLASRAEAVAKRRDRAKKVTLQDIMLSRLLTEGGPADSITTSHSVPAIREIVCDIANKG
jgi:hypothetical protein